jgi:hypothetical protein
MKYKYNGAKSLILLHEKHITNFHKTWLEAKSNNIPLPKTDDPDYQSLNTLLRHVLRSARGYMVWICEKLNLPDPEIEITPEPSNVHELAENYLEHLIMKWRIPLQNIEEEYFIHKTYESNWGTQYCIDAMLEHAVMHPLRHQFQLECLIVNQLESNNS